MRKRILVSIAGIIALWLCGCSTGVEQSPAPGIVRVTIKADETDTTIIIRSDTVRFSRWDSFILYLSGGRLYRGENYAVLYQKTNSRESMKNVNIIAREWLSGVPIAPNDADEIHTGNSRFIKYTVYESYAPPGDYDKLEVSIIGKEMDTYIPKIYQNPVKVPDTVSTVMAFKQKYTVESGKTTEINLEVKPYSSLQRYRDLFLFNRQVAVVSVK